MAETIGSLVDKISIAELKIFHMQEQVDRADAAPEHRERCRQRVDILKRQRDDLAAEMNELVERWSQGLWMPRVYRQFKMYNDPQYRMKPETPRAR
jgi:hypothetical protein